MSAFKLIKDVLHTVTINLVKDVPCLEIRPEKIKQRQFCIVLHEHLTKFNDLLLFRA